MLRWSVAVLLSVMLLLVAFSLLWPGSADRAALRVLPPSPAPTRSSFDVRGRPSLSAAFVDQVLAAYHSPAAGLGQAVADLSRAAGIDDAYVLAFFGHESTFGTRGVATLTHSWGNIICTLGYPSCLGRFRAYPSFRAGLQDFLHLLTSEYLPVGRTTLDAIIPVYAPASENDVAGYIAAVKSFVLTWRAGQVRLQGEVQP